MRRSLKSLKGLISLCLYKQKSGEKKHLFKRGRCAEYDVICYFALSCCFIISNTNFWTLLQMKKS